MSASNVDRGYHLERHHEHADADCRPNYDAHKHKLPRLAVPVLLSPSLYGRFVRVGLLIHAGHSRCACASTADRALSKYGRRHVKSARLRVVDQSEIKSCK